MTEQNQDGFPGLQEQPEPITVHLHLLIDISTSMLDRWKQTVSGLNEYIESLRLDENHYKVTVTEFGLENEVVDLFADADLDKVTKFNEKQFYPHGRGTALWGAVGISLKKINTDEPVLFVVITDGDDNSSHTYGSESVNKLIEDRVKMGNYTFAYLGVAKEAWGQESKVMAFAASNQTMDKSAYGAETYRSLSTRTAMYSNVMRSNRISGQSMSVSSLYDPNVMPDLSSSSAVPLVGATNHNSSSADEPAAPILSTDDANEGL